MNRQIAGLIYEMTAGHCWYCGLHIAPFSNWEIEHQQPRSRGGSDHLSNLVPACRACNRAKGTMNVDEFREFLLMKFSVALTKADYEISDRLYSHSPNLMKIQDRLIELVKMTMPHPDFDVLFYGENDDAIAERESMLESNTTNEDGIG